MSGKTQGSRQRAAKVGQDEGHGGVRKPASGSRQPAAGRIPSNVELAGLISSLIDDVRYERITPGIANAAFTGVSRLFKLSQLIEKHGGGRILPVNPEREQTDAA